MRWLVTFINLLLTIGFTASLSQRTEVTDESYIVGCTFENVLCDKNDKCINDGILWFCGNEKIASFVDQYPTYTANVASDSDIDQISRKLSSIPKMKLKYANSREIQCWIKIVVFKQLGEKKTPKPYLPSKNCVRNYQNTFNSNLKKYNTQDSKDKKDSNNSTIWGDLSKDDKFYVILNRMQDQQANSFKNPFKEDVKNTYFDNPFYLNSYEYNNHNLKNNGDARMENNFKSDRNSKDSNVYNDFESDKNSNMMTKAEMSFINLLTKIGRDYNMTNDQLTKVAIHLLWDNSTNSKNELINSEKSNKGKLNAIDNSRNTVYSKGDEIDVDEEIPSIFENIEKEPLDQKRNFTSHDIFIYIDPALKKDKDVFRLTRILRNIYQLRRDEFQFVNYSHDKHTLHFYVNSTIIDINDLIRFTYMQYKHFSDILGYNVKYIGGRSLNNSTTVYQNITSNIEDNTSKKLKDHNYIIVVSVVVIGCLLAILATILLCIKRRSTITKKFRTVIKDLQKPNSYEYQELCKDQSETDKYALRDKQGDSKFSLSSWNADNIGATNIDIITAHTVLAYMESYLNDETKLSKEWETMKLYTPEYTSSNIGARPKNYKKNINPNIITYDHNRFCLNADNSSDNSDYINASYITDHDPRSPRYIVTQCPMKDTIADFWQMVWESYANSIVCLCNLNENVAFVQYWPSRGSQNFGIYELHLISEHVKKSDYLIRCFYIRNINTNETRTITQFHYNSWSNNEIPVSSRTFLEYRGKIEKSYKSGISPTIIHCSNGAGRSGLFILVDMVINRIMKGVKQLDISATLEHLRDQRKNVIETRNQFEFAFTSIAEQVTDMINTIPK